MTQYDVPYCKTVQSLSSRRAWIEIRMKNLKKFNYLVALLTESVD